MSIGIQNYFARMILQNYYYELRNDTKYGRQIKAVQRNMTAVHYI